MFKKYVPVWVVPSLIIFATGTVWLRLAIIRTTYMIGQAEKTLEILHKDRDLLEVKVTALRSPQRLEVLARTQFKLAQPKGSQIVHLKKDSDLGFN